MSSLHLLIPFATTPALGCQQVTRQLVLPHLDALLARLTLQAKDEAEVNHFAMPHERALARHLGLPEHSPPWAAWQARSSDGAWAFVTPCHWQIGADAVTLTDPENLALDEAASRALLAILAPWFAEDGITLHYDQPTRWLAQGAIFADLETASLERVLQRNVRAWLPDAQRARLLHRLHSEMQMLLYTHPFNEARAASGLLPVNAFWLHGAGCLDTLPKTVVLPDMPDTLRAAALREDWPAWATAWQALDAGAVARLANHVAAGGAAQLTLCGERAAWTWHTTRRSLRQRMRSLLSPQRFATFCHQL